MKWKKLGKIFDPTKNELISNCREYAQSPQVLSFHNFVRIYFATREKDKSGKYLSHISFIDIDSNLQNILSVSTKTVIELGELGCFDEHGISLMNVLRVKNKVYGYTNGISRKKSVPVETCIGLAISHDDGITFEKYGLGPILTSSLGAPFLVGDPFVKIFNDTFHMWYIVGEKWKKKSNRLEPDRVYKIAHAISKDGKKWIRSGEKIVSDKIGKHECQALPTVFSYKNRYHMIFCYRDVHDFRTDFNCSYKLGYAFSYDLIQWKRDDSILSLSIENNDWDSGMQCYPHVFQVDI